jgi:hypothetical protein
MGHDSTIPPSRSNGRLLRLWSPSKIATGPEFKMAAILAGVRTMSLDKQPLVSVMTPVYNGEDFLAECIESVLNQTYQNFEYIIVNNCSKDRSLQIAQEYAKKDARIKIHDNEKFVGVIDNHNTAFNLMSPNAKYCKMVSADDYIFPDCIAKMVELAEANPSIGFVGTYQLSGDIVRWQGFMYPVPRQGTGPAVFPRGTNIRQRTAHFGVWNSELSAVSGRPGARQQRVLSQCLASLRYKRLLPLPAAM